MSKKDNRRKEIVKLLQLRNGATIKELAGMFNVSEMTIRRDLQVLEAENLINLVHGAAIYNPQSLAHSRLKEYNLATAKGLNNEAKNRIGKYAAGLIENNDFVIIDTGSTTEKIIPHVSIDKKFSLYCYGSNIMVSAVSKPNIKLYMGGGEYKPETMMFVFQENVDYVNKLRATKVFISAAGIDKEHGVTCMHTYESDIKYAIKNSAVELILVADSSKFGKVSPAYYGEIEEFRTIVTDKDLDSEWEDYLKDLGINLILV